MNTQPHKRLAERLDAMPNGFPATEDGAELRLLEALYTPAEALLVSQLRITKEPLEQIGQRIGEDPSSLRKQLKGLARRGLIAAGMTPEGELGYGLLPFVVGIYEMQIGRIDETLAKLFEDYYYKAFGQMLSISPAVHRVIPVNESVRMNLEVKPFESAAEIIADAKSWGVLDCICRKQKALIGEPCGHPVDVCMALSSKPDAFERNPVIKGLTQEEAMATLQRAASAGLVHSVSNNQEGLGYICNCCTCSCGILRGMSDLGIANVVARSAFVNTVDETVCTGCEICVDSCQFDALTLSDEFFIHVNEARCVGCGVCVPNCIEDALALVKRPDEELKPIPVTEAEWARERAYARGLDLRNIM